jgi:hypothetical protein
MSADTVTLTLIENSTKINDSEIAQTPIKNRNTPTHHKTATTTTMLSLGTEEHSRPSSTAPHATAPYVVAVAVTVEADQPVQASSLQTQAHERPSAGNTFNNQGVTVTNVEIELQANADPGIVFRGDPLRVLHLTQPIPSLVREGTNIEGYYFHSLRLPGLEIKNVVHEQQLNNILTANRHLPRTLVVSSHPPLASKNGCHYKHDLPVTEHLGLHFTGFPAKVQSVDPNSFMVGKIHPGQSVSAVIVPGLADLTMLSGGFAGSHVQQHLQTYRHVPNKQLTVMDQHQAMFVQHHTSRRGVCQRWCDCLDSCFCVDSYYCDDCVIL